MYYFIFAFIPSAVLISPTPISTDLVVVVSPHGVGLFSYASFLFYHGLARGFCGILVSLDFANTTLSFGLTLPDVIASF